MAWRQFGPIRAPLTNEERFPNKCVVNLSDQPLTAGQLSLLSKGLKFCPDPGAPALDLVKSDFDYFHRVLRLKQKFSEDGDGLAFRNTQPLRPNTAPPNQGQGADDWRLRDRFHAAFDHPRFCKKSTWNPAGPPALEAFITANESRFVSDQSFRRTVDNLTQAECEALRYFKSASHLVIKPADKGSAVVVMNLDDYISEGFRQLQDPNFYTEVPTDLSESHMSNVIAVVSEMCSNGEISERCKQYLCDFKYRTARFYMLPKIHKGVFPPPGRHIISCNYCPTEKISQFVDHFLKPVAQPISYKYYRIWEVFRRAVY